MAMQRIVLGTRKGIVIFELIRDQWQIVHHGFRGIRVSIVFLDHRTGHLFACLDHGHFGNKLFRWDNYAECEEIKGLKPDDVWKDIGAPTYPEGAKLPNGNDAVLTYQWAMAAGSDQQPGRIYVGSEPGGLFVSDDNGDNFEINLGLWDHPSRLNEDLPWFGGGLDQAGIHSICVDPRDDRVIRVGISCAGVFLTEDGGENWRPTNTGCSAEFLPDPNSEVGQDPHLLVQCASDPKTLWQQNHCGVYVSRNDGMTWEKVSETEGIVNFGFAVAVDSENPDVAWVVPAESDQVRIAVDNAFCVSRTDDGGKTWQSFREGLPQVGCFDFSYRHGLIYRDNELVVGTACGSLYHSGDRGETWRELSMQLPPIYCVIGHS